MDRANAVGAFGKISLVFIIPRGRAKNGEFAPLAFFALPDLGLTLSFSIIWPLLR